MKTKILKILRQNPEESLSGQELCSQLGVSRTAVWKVINQLKDEGYEIEAIQNKGYRILKAPDSVSKSEIGSRLLTKWIGKELIYMEEVGSTNSEIKKKAEEGASHGTLVVTDYQNAGRGRRGRGWESSKGKSIAMSILLRPEFEPDKASTLTLVMALSVAKAIQKTTDLPCQIKWPNDLVLNGKKICGILTEMNAERDYIHYIVIGVGINVNQEDFPKEVKDKATSLFLEQGIFQSRAELIAAVMKEFEEDYECYLKTEDMSEMLEEYNSYLINKGKGVKVLEPQSEYEGIARGINKAGELLVERENGNITTVYAGEVSVRGFYGYV